MLILEASGSRCSDIAQGASPMAFDLATGAASHSLSSQYSLNFLSAVR